MTKGCNYVYLLSNVPRTPRVSSSNSRTGITVYTGIATNPTRRLRYRNKRNDTWRLEIMIGPLLDSAHVFYKIFAHEKYRGLKTKFERLARLGYRKRIFTGWDNILTINTKNGRYIQYNGQTRLGEIFREETEKWSTLLLSQLTDEQKLYIGEDCDSSAKQEHTMSDKKTRNGVLDLFSPLSSSSQSSSTSSIFQTETIDVSGDDDNGRQENERIAAAALSEQHANTRIPAYAKNIVSRLDNSDSLDGFPKMVNQSVDAQKEKKRRGKTKGVTSDDDERDDNGKKTKDKTKKKKTNKKRKDPEPTKKKKSTKGKKKDVEETDTDDGGEEDEDEGEGEFLDDEDDNLEKEIKRSSPAKPILVQGRRDRDQLMKMVIGSIAETKNFLPSTVLVDALKNIKFSAVAQFDWPTRTSSSVVSWIQFKIPVKESHSIVDLQLVETSATFGVASREEPKDIEFIRLSFEPDKLDEPSLWTTDDQLENQEKKNVELDDNILQTPIRLFVALRDLFYGKKEDHKTLGFHYPLDILFALYVSIAISNNDVISRIYDNYGEIHS